MPTQSVGIVGSAVGGKSAAQTAAMLAKLEFECLTGA